MKIIETSVILEKEGIIKIPKEELMASGLKIGDELSIAFLTKQSGNEICSARELLISKE